MTILGKNVLPEVQFGAVPFWRQWLRGLSQCAFQANELTGIIFVVAVAVFDWRMAVFYAMSVLIATVVARLLKGDGELLDLGLFGFNSGLMGLALGAFYQPNAVLWVTVAILAAVVAALAVAMGKWLPIPFLAAPFILTFWVMWWIADMIATLIKLDLSAFPDADVLWGTAIISALGATLFSPAVVTGLLFLLGILVSNWRHAVVAVIGAVVAVALATHVAHTMVAGAEINSGFVGFNAVLAALAAYVVIAADLRLAVLAAVLATWFFSYMTRNAPVPALASGFVISIWFIQFLGWLNGRFGAAQEPEPMPEGESVWVEDVHEHGRDHDRGEPEGPPRRRTR